MPLSQTQPNDSTLNDPQNTVLRYLIRDAVEREITTQLAPLKNQIQIIDANLRETQKDIGKVTNAANQLTAVVFGDDITDTQGLLRDVRSITNKLNSWENQLKGARSILAVLSGLVGIDIIRYIAQFLKVLP